jgi:hypothetical protein
MEQITTFLERGSEPNPSIRIISRAIGIQDASAELSMPLNIQLTANGVDLPFAETCESLWKGWQEAAQRGVEERARELAQQMVLGIGMAQLTEALNTAGRLVSNAVDEMASKVGGEDPAWEPLHDDIHALRHAKLSSQVACDLRQKWEDVFGGLRGDGALAAPPSLPLFDPRILWVFVFF